MTLPQFETARLILRPRSLADTDRCIQMDSDPEVVRYVMGPWLHPTRHRSFIEERTRGPFPPGQGYWSIARKGVADDFIGWIVLIPIDAKGPEIETGWRLRRDMWGQGYATEAARPVLHHGFATLGLNEIIAEIEPANAASIHVAEKLGLRYQRVIPRDERSTVIYAMTREEYRQRHPTSCSP
ncbi:MAG: GNAT family N-acetyltransferase [Alphaproteobacteria bacterium]|nr:GNAT family N-acetyltransferase [Alphaproteobacteria bacterium]